MHPCPALEWLSRSTSNDWMSPDRNFDWCFENIHSPYLLALAAIELSGITDSWWSEPNRSALCARLEAIGFPAFDDAAAANAGPVDAEFAIWLSVNTITPAFFTKMVDAGVPLYERLWYTVVCHFWCSDVDAVLRELARLKCPEMRRDERTRFDHMLVVSAEVPRTKWCGLFRVLFRELGWTFTVRNWISVARSLDHSARFTEEDVDAMLRAAGVLDGVQAMWTTDTSATTATGISDRDLIDNACMYCPNASVYFLKAIGRPLKPSLWVSNDAPSNDDLARLAKNGCPLPPDPDDCHRIAEQLCRPMKISSKLHNTLTPEQFAERVEILRRAGFTCDVDEADRHRPLTWAEKLRISP